MVSKYNLILCLLLSLPLGGLGQETACEGRSCAEVQGDGDVLLQAKIAVALEDGKKAQKRKALRDEIQDDEEDEKVADMINKETEEIAADMASKAVMLMEKGGSMIHDMVHTAADEEDSTQDGPSSQMVLPFNVPFDTSKYTNKVELISQLRHSVGAVAYYKLDANFIHLGLAANAGFVGFGMNPHGPSMRRADIVVCREYTPGTVSAADYYSKKNAAPVLDDVQDWITVNSGHAAAAHGRQVTWCEIRRRRVTCETEEDYQAYKDTTSLFGLLAFSQPFARTDQFSYHGYHQRKVFSFHFKESNVALAQTNTQELNVIAPDVEVPTKAGSYIDSYHILPIDVNTEYHLTWFKVVRGTAVQDNVFHHADLKVCTQAIPNQPSNTIVSTDLAMKYCSEVLLSSPAAYSPAGDTLPSDAGIPLGKHGARIVALSRHFYNPSNKKGVVDRNTYYKIRYTTTLRPNNFVILVLATPSIRIPARTSESVTTSFCPSDCTSRLKGTTEIRQVNFHMHGKGLRTKIRIIRDGQELEPIAELDPWDVAMNSVFVNRLLVPGDDLNLECIYSNSEDRIIGYGESLGDEMCVGQLKIVGPGSLKMCVDILWKERVPKACIMKNGKIRPWPQCNINTPRTSCPDAHHPKGKPGATVLNPSARSWDKPFVKYVPEAGTCNKAGDGKVLVPAIAGSCVAPAIEKPTAGSERIPQGAGDRSDESRTDLTAEPAQPGVILGGMDCGTGNMAFKVSWATNCKDRTITFEAEVEGSPGWIAIGLLDGGAADAPLRCPGARMRDTDIVQAMPLEAKLKDGTGVGYMPPKKKQAAVASYVSGGSRHGKSYVKFVRPLDSPEGLSLTEKGFVYLVCAARFDTASFDAKHTIATHSETRISLFGGIPESYKEDGSIVPPAIGGSIVPPTKMAKPKDCETRTSGRCDETHGQPSSLAECWALAGNVGMYFIDSRDFTGAVHGRKFPKGCFLQKKSKELFFNKDGQSDCSEDNVCACKLPKKAEPEPEPEPEPKKAEPEPEPEPEPKKAEPEPEPEPEQAEPEPEPEPEPKNVEPEPEPEAEAEVAYRQRTGTCPAAERVAKDDCRAKAAELKLKYAKFITKRLRKWPAGCYLSSGGGKVRLYFNTEQGSKVACGKKRSFCICAKKQKIA